MRPLVEAQASATLSAGDDSALSRALARAEELSVFPQVAVRIQEVVADRASSIGELEQAVSLDATLGAKLLRTANSPFYGLRRQVGSLSRAILVLGFDATRDLALSLTLASLGSTRDPQRERLWLRSLRCAAAAQLLVPHADGLLDDSEAFVAGLTGDLGCLVLLEIERRRYAPLLERHLTSANELVAAELTEFGFTHAELSAACLRYWGLPERITSIVRFHHVPAAAPQRELMQRAEVLLAANLLADGEQPASVHALLPQLAARLDEDALEGALEGLDARTQAWAETLA